MFIGKNEIKSYKEIKGEILLVEVTYKDDSVEWLSKLMFDEIKSEELCDETELRDRRVVPVVAEMLKVLRNWGLKMNELPHMSALLTTSLQESQNEALNELWSKWMPRPRSPDEVDLVTLDRVLKSRKLILKDVIGK